LVRRRRRAGESDWADGTGSVAMAPSFPPRCHPLSPRGTMTLELDQRQDKPETGPWPSSPLAAPGLVSAGCRAHAVTGGDRRSFCSARKLRRSQPDGLGCGSSRRPQVADRLALITAVRYSTATTPLVPDFRSVGRPAAAASPTPPPATARHLPLCHGRGHRTDGATEFRTAGQAADYPPLVTRPGRIS